MARGTQHRKRRPAANAGAGRSTATVASPPKRHQPPQWQEELFFARLRAHAKWVFVALAVVFAVGFVAFGVGSGSNGLSDAFQSAFHFGGGGGSSISKLEKKTTQHPADAKAWNDLATAYEQKQRTADAVRALERYVALRPHDQDGLNALAAEQTQLANSYGTQLQQLEADAAVVAPQAAFVPPTSSPLGKLYTDPNGLQDPIDTALQSQEQTALQDLNQKLLAADSAAEATYAKLAALNPQDATTQLSLGQAAQRANDNGTAIAAFKRFLKLAPDDPLAPQVRQVLKALKSTSSGTTSSASG